MKHINKILFLSCTVLFFSCTKNLDLNPTDSFTQAAAFQNLQDIQYGVNLAYQDFGAYSKDMYTNALLSDEAKIGTGNAGQGLFGYRFQYGSDNTSGSDVTGAWGSYYSVINQANIVLAAMEGVSVPASLQPRKNELRGQLLGLRAISHFQLLQSFAATYPNNTAALGVPIITNFNILALPKRNTIGEVMTQIEKDIADANALLPNVTAATFTDTVINKINLEAFQARIALYKGDYANAIKYSTDVINSGAKPLVTDPDFSNIWTDDGDGEILFKIRYTNSTAIGGMWSTTSPSYYIAPSDKLVATYDPADIRLGAYVGTSASAGNYVNKFYTSSRGGLTVDMKVCRTAEIYLIRAEAYAKQANPDVSSGAADINLLRTQRILTYSDQSFGSATELSKAVADERYKELCFEGFRFFDLKRTGQSVSRGASDANALWQTLPANSYRFVLPIPIDELNANHNCVQNPGY